VHRPLRQGQHDKASTLDSSPIQIPVHQDPRVPIICLRVAALCTCLDHGYYRNEAFTRAETVGFFGASGTGLYAEDGQELNGWLDPHAFTHIPSIGNVELAENQLLAGLIASIKSRELSPVQLRMNLDGEVDIYDTWIKLNDLVDWCDVRSIEIGDLINTYHDGEDTIMDHALTSGNHMRQRFETPHFNARFNPRVAAEIREDQVTVDQYRELLAENIILSQQIAAGLYPQNAQEDEKPVQERERRTFLLIIAALCKEANHDFHKHAKTAAIIKRTADIMGLAIGESTIEGKLKLIADALESRVK
jgi:hypothetical protein